MSNADAVNPSEVGARIDPSSNANTASPTGRPRNSDVRLRQIMPIQEFMDLTGKSRSTIDRWRRSGRLQSIQPGGPGTSVMIVVPADMLLDAAPPQAGAAESTTDPGGEHQPQIPQEPPGPGRKLAWKRAGGLRKSPSR